MRATINLLKIRATVFGFLVAIILGFVAGFQLLGQSRDYENYLIYFDFASNSLLPEVLAHRFEPGFAVLAYLLAAFQLGGPSIYSFIVGGSMFLKYFSLRTTINFWPTYAVFTIYYIARYFTLFEMTVLRTAVAIAIAFFVFFTRNDHEYRWKHLLLLLVAVSFHYSSIIFIPIYILRPERKGTVIAAGVVCFITILVSRSLALEFLPNYVPVFTTYNEFTKSTILPVPFAVDIVFFLFVLFQWNNNDTLMKTCALGMAISVAFHFSFLDYSIFASRFRELLSIFFLLYIVRAITYARNETKCAAVIFAAVSAAIHLYATYIHDTLLT